MDNDLRLSSETEKAWLASIEPPEPPSGFDEDKQIMAAEDEAVAGRRAHILEKYGYALADQQGPRRHAMARRAAKVIKDPDDQAWLLGQVAELSKAEAFTRADSKGKKGFVRRVAERLYELPQAAAAGGTDIAESFSGLGRVIGGGDQDERQVSFKRALESAYQSGDPEGYDETGAVWKGARGGARIAPQIALGAGAYQAGGKLLLGASSGLQAMAPIRERYIAEGISPVSATSLAALTAGISGAVETAVPVPGMGRGGVAGVGEKLAGKIAAKAGAGKAASEILKTTGRAAGEYLTEVAGEEFVQAGAEAAGSLAGAAIEGRTAGRSLAEVPAEALEAVRGAAGPMAPFSLLGGGVRVAKSLGNAKTRAEIHDYATKGKTPSRTDWKRWGLNPENGASAADRKVAVRQLDEVFSAEGKAAPAAEDQALGEKIEQAKASVERVEPAETVTEVAPPATPTIPAETVEQQIVGFQTSTELAKAYHTADKDVESEPWYQRVKSLKDSGLNFAHILESAKRRVSEPAARSEGELFPAEMEETIRQGIGPAPADWHVMDVNTPVPASDQVEVAKFGDRGYWRMKKGEPTMDRRAWETEPAEATAAEVPATEVGVQAGEVNQPDAATKKRGFLRGDQSGALVIGGERGDVGIDDTVAGLTPEQATKAMDNPDPEVNTRIQKRGYASYRGWLEGKGEGLKKWGHVITRAQEHIPSGEKFAVANEVWRVKKSVRAASTDKAMRDVSGIVGGLGPQQEVLLGLYMSTADQVRSVYMDKAEPMNFGYKKVEDLEAYQKQLTELVAKTPAVKDAVERRGKMVRELATDLVANDLLEKSALDDVEHYVHHQIAMYDEGFKRASRDRSKKSFQKHRVKAEDVGDGEQVATGMPEQWDPSTSYIEPEVAWMADAYAALEQKRLNEEVLKEYDGTEQILAESKATGKSVQEVAVSRGYEEHEVIPSMLGHSLASLPARIVSQTRKQIFDQMGLSKDERKLANKALGGSKTVFLPKEIAAQMEADENAPEPNWIDEVVRDTMSAWKAWTLLNPKRAIGYNLRNITGDLDPVLAADPAIILESLNSIRDLKALNDPSSKLSAEARASRDYGVIGSGWAGTEVNDLKKIPFFRRFTKKGGPGGPIDAYMRFVQGGTVFRENLLRHAAFLRYKKLLERGDLKHFGASRRKVVKNIQRALGNDAAAAHLARNLLGDYGDMTVMGNYLRDRLIPFWAWNEINIKRAPKLVVNALSAGVGSSVRLGAVKAAVATARIGAMYSALWMWNNLAIPAMTGDDDERDLPPYDRANPHVLLGRNADGTVRVFRNVGAVGDLLEWFGINESLAILPKWQEGQVTGGDVWTEAWHSVIEKMVGMIRPDVKSGFEVVTGTSTFPSPFNLRKVDRGEAASELLGLSDEYKWLKGKVTKEGDRARPHYGGRLLYGVVDPRATRLNEMYDLRYSYMKSIGKESGGIHPVSEYKQAKEAAINGDREAFLEWKRTFIERHGFEKSADNFVRYLKRVDPIAGSLGEEDEIQFEYKYLTNEQRASLRGVREYSAELRDLMVTWWTEDKEKYE